MARPCGHRTDALPTLPQASELCLCRDCSASHQVPGAKACQSLSAVELFRGPVKGSKVRHRTPGQRTSPDKVPGNTSSGPLGQVKVNTSILCLRRMAMLTLHTKQTLQQRCSVWKPGNEMAFPAPTSRMRHRQVSKPPSTAGASKLGACSLGASFSHHQGLRLHFLQGIGRRLRDHPTEAYPSMVALSTPSTAGSKAMQHKAQRNQHSQK